MGPESGSKRGDLEKRNVFGPPLDNTRGAGGREALSNTFWFPFIVNVQYEYNWIRLRQLTYLSETQKVILFWDPSAGYTIR